MRIRKPLVAAMLAVASLVVFSAPAAGHAVLTGTDPAPDSTVDEALATVRLEFNEAVRFAQVEVVGPGGEDVADGPPLEMGDIVEQPLVALTATGEYAVAYRVTSEDDHPVEGSFTFGYQGPVEEAEPGAEGVPAPETTVDPGLPGDQAPVGPDDEVDETAADADGRPAWVLPVLLLAVVAVGGAVLARRRSGEPEA